MSEHNPQSPATQFLLISAGLVIIVAGMRAAEAILVPLLVSAFLAIISATPVFWLQRKRVPGPLAVFIVVLGVLGIGVGFGTLIGTSLQDFSEAIPRYQEVFTTEIAPLLQWLQTIGIQLSEDALLQYIDPGASYAIGREHADRTWRNSHQYAPYSAHRDFYSS